MVLGLIAHRRDAGGPQPLAGCCQSAQDVRAGLARLAFIPVVLPHQLPLAILGSKLAGEIGKGLEEFWLLCGGICADRWVPPVEVCPCRVS